MHNLYRLPAQALNHQQLFKTLVLKPDHLPLHLQRQTVPAILTEIRNRKKGQLIFPSTKIITATHVMVSLNN